LNAQRVSRRLSKPAMIAVTARLGVIWPTARCKASSAANFRACAAEKEL
jgi:hypothetical protein